VVLAGVEVDVVAHLERQVQAHHRQGVQRRLDTAAGVLVGQQAGDPGPDVAPPGPALSHEGVQRRRGEHRVVKHRRQVEDPLADADPDPARAAFRLEYAVGQVRRPEQ
jgi:hypothetical protein